MKRKLLLTLLAVTIVSTTIPNTAYAATEATSPFTIKSSSESSGSSTSVEINKTYSTSTGTNGNLNGSGDLNFSSGHSEGSSTSESYTIGHSSSYSAARSTDLGSLGLHNWASALTDAGIKTASKLIKNATNRTASYSTTYSSGTSVGYSTGVSTQKLGFPEYYTEDSITYGQSETATSYTVSSTNGIFDTNGHYNESISGNFELDGKFSRDCIPAEYRTLLTDDEWKLIEACDLTKLNSITSIKNIKLESNSRGANIKISKPEASIMIGIDFSEDKKSANGVFVGNTNGTATVPKIKPYKMVALKTLPYGAKVYTVNGFDYGYFFADNYKSVTFFKMDKQTGKIKAMSFNPVDDSAFSPFARFDMNSVLYYMGDTYAKEAEKIIGSGSISENTDHGIGFEAQEMQIETLPN